MVKPVGGRGVKAPYETTHVRVPKPIKPQVERLIEQFQAGGDSQSENLLTSLDDAVATAKGILLQKKSARVSIQKLLTSIYGENVTL
jgi:hypothetical protein